MARRVWILWYWCSRQLFAIHFIWSLFTNNELWTTLHYTVYSFIRNSHLDMIVSYNMWVQAHVSEIDLPWWRVCENNKFHKKMILIAGFSYTAKKNVNERINWTKTTKRAKNPQIDVTQQRDSVKAVSVIHRRRRRQYFSRATLLKV